MLNNIFNSSEKNFIFISLPSILVVLLPFFLITGPFLPDLAISICATLFLIDSALRTHPPPTRVRDGRARGALRGRRRARREHVRRLGVRHVAPDRRRRAGR